MELIDDQVVPDMPGLIIQKLDSGALKVTAKTCHLCETLESLKTLSELSDVHIREIDLTDFLSTFEGHRYHHDIAHKIVPFLFREQLIRIIIPTEVIHQVRGACKGVVVESFRKSFGTSIQLSCTTVPVRKCVMTEEILNKILPSNCASLQDINTTIDVLRYVQTQDEVPYILQNTILQTARHIRKLKRNKKNALQSEQRQLTESDAIIDPLSACSDSDYNDRSDMNWSATSKYMSNCLPKLATDQTTNDNVLACLNTNMHCYVCKKRYCFPKKPKNVDIAWHQYPKLCHFCAAHNYRKRNQKTDLNGKYAIVTGGRIKIGYYIVLKLLRDGAHVIATTRFPRDAAKRFLQESDFGTFKDRLKIYPLEMKSLSDVYSFIQYVYETYPHLDILINNAAQTISRPVTFYEHLLDHETVVLSSIPSDVQQLLATVKVLDYYGANKTRVDCEDNILMSRQTPPCVTECNSSITSSTYLSQTHSSHCKRFDVCSDDDYSDGKGDSYKRSKTEYLEGHSDTSSESTIVLCTDSGVTPRVTTAKHNARSTSVSGYFPPGQLDADGQQLDLRPMNTWRMPIEDVSVSELLEVLAINAVAPFILNQGLKSLLDKSPSSRRFIVNVSAMEGQFTRVFKSQFHPHTNMAKAALNMLTRTAAVGYRESGVYMTAVDTGWVTDERPYPQAKYEENKGFILPLDSIDGAARVYDPIVCGLNNTEEPYYAVFLKDYNTYPW